MNYARIRLENNESDFVYLPDRHEIIAQLGMCKYGPDRVKCERRRRLVSYHVDFRLTVATNYLRLRVLLDLALGLGSSLLYLAIRLEQMLCGRDDGGRRKASS